MSETHPRALPKGCRVEEYEITRVLGAGGFGITYLALDTKLDGPVALKEYFPHGNAARAGDRCVAAAGGTSGELFAWGLDRFLEEARSVHRFRHPNVMRVHRYLEAHGTAYIVMEYVDGEPLEGVLNARAPVPAGKWRGYMERLLDGLVHIHEHEYLHRDIKPSNVILRTADGEPVLVDFGAARAATHGRTHTHVLTPPYAPLEQYGNEYPQGPPTDIYALAVVSYRALTGNLPPPAPDRAIKDRYQPLAGRVAGAELPWLLAIDRALALRAEDRPQTVVDWRAALRSGSAAGDRAPGIGALDLGGDAGAIRECLPRRTFVGIDFGTSTTVVSIVRPHDATGLPAAEPLQIPQPDADGRPIADHLVPSCLAWRNDRLLVGQGAAQEKPRLREGIDIWTSFKMQLGRDLGPDFPNTALAKGRGQVVIERSRDAAVVFFKHLRTSVDRHIADRALPPPAYAVSVPAAFEANQRRDLVRALDEAGIPVQDAALVDEPNAAFLSYVFEMERGARGVSVSSALRQRERRVLVFDFGAGTCDVSVLQVGVAHGSLSSRNLAISKFLALGGDDIDRAIARQVLLPELCGDAAPDDAFSLAELEQAVLPRLKPAAEELKIQCCKWIEREKLREPSELAGRSEAFRAKPLDPIELRGASWTLREPTMVLPQFAEVMRPFLADPLSGKHVDGFDDDHSERMPSVIESVANALEKAGITRDELDMVLFIGGSCANPLVRQAIEAHVGRFVDCVAPRDLRSHVSQGAALHALYFHGLGRDLIQPITSEPIYVVTRDDHLDLVLAAGSPVPSPPTLTSLRVGQAGQTRVELPLCVSGRDKVLGVLAVPAPAPPGCFEAGETLRVACRVSREKLLEVEVHVGNVTVAADILNPLANVELGPQRRRLLQARQALNESILAGRGRPSVEAVLTYARAAQKAKRWREAAEMYAATERLDRGSDHAVSIAYNYPKFTKIADISVEIRRIRACRGR